MQLKSSYKKFLIIFLVIAGLVAGLYFFITKAKAKQQQVVTVSSMTSCSDPEVVQMLASQVSGDIKQKTVVNLQTYVLNVGKSYDTARFENIFNSLDVKVANIRAQDQTSSDGTLSCTASVKVTPSINVFTDASTSLHALGASTMQGCTDECGDDINGNSSLESQALDGSLKYNGKSVSASGLDYTLQKDADGKVILSYTAPDLLVSFMTSAIVDALNLSNTLAKTAKDKADADAQTAETNQKLALVQQAMDLRLKEVNATNEAANNQLNTLWQAAGTATTQSLLDEQRDWLKKRDVDCQIKAEQDWYQLKDDEKQSYNLEHESWSPLMISTDKEIRRVICVAKRTNDRIAPLTQEITAVHDRLLAAQATAAPSKP